MILGKNTMFSDKQAVATGASDVIDLGDTGTPAYGNKLKRDLGFGTKIPFLVQLVEEVVGATNITAILQTSDTEDFADFNELVSAKFEGMKVGDRCRLPVIPYGECKRYMRMYYEVEGTATKGKITAGITAGNDETVPFI